MINYNIEKYKISIGSHPNQESDIEEYIKNYDLVLNVSDEPYFPKSNKVHFFPINEVGEWFPQTFYWFIHLMNDAVAENKNVYVHCHAGIHRSPMMVYVYLRSLGHTAEESEILMEGNKSFAILGNETYDISFEKFLERDIKAGRIQTNIIEFVRYLQENKKESLMVALSKTKSEYFRPRKKIEPEERVDLKGIF